MTLRLLQKRFANYVSIEAMEKSITNRFETIVIASQLSLLGGVMFTTFQTACDDSKNSYLKFPFRLAVNTSIVVGCVFAAVTRPLLVLTPFIGTSAYFTCKDMDLKLSVSE